MQGWLQDLRVGYRVMKRSPVITGVAILTIALGIGATTAVFSLVNGILLRPLPYREANRLVAVWNALPGIGFPQFAQSAALHFTYEEHSRAFDAIGLWASGGATVRSSGEAEVEQGVWLTHGTMEALGIQPAVGRRFTLSDDSPASPSTVMLSYRYWQETFGGRPDVVGQTLQVDGELREIIGVTQPGRFLGEYDPAFYVPERIDRSNVVAGQFLYASLARLAPGVTLRQAEADMARLIPVHIEAFPGGMSLQDVSDYGMAPLVRPLREDVLGTIGSRLWVIFGAAVLLLVIAAANAANLVMVLAEGRQRELAIRVAMGASRGRVGRQLLVEGTVLGLLGGLPGIVLAQAALGVIRALNPGDLPRLHEVSIDPVVLLFTLGLSMLTGLVFGRVPLVGRFRCGLVDTLKIGGGTTGTSPGRNRLRNALAAAQIAAALVLLVGAGLLVRSLREIGNLDPGFLNPETVLTLQVAIPGVATADEEETFRTHHLIRDRLAELPGVATVGLTSKLPMSRPGTHVNPVWVEGSTLVEGIPPPSAQFTWVDGEYFASLGIPVLAGRALTGADARDRIPVVVVSESFAVRNWSSPAEAIGKRISSGRSPGENGWREIVGVVGNVRDDGITQPVPEITYWPLITPSPFEAAEGSTLYAPRTVSYAIRSERAGTPDLLRDVRATITSVNPDLSPQATRMLDDVVSGSIARTWFMLAMLGIAAIVAVVLGITGAYGVVSHVASQRTREFGVRITLGASPAAVTRLVLGHGLLLSGLGVGAGLLLAFWGGRLVEAFLYGVDSRDPVTFAIAALILIPTTLLACLLPAWRAVRTDPNRALRSG